MFDTLTGGQGGIKTSQQSTAKGKSDLANSFGWSGDVSFGDNSDHWVMQIAPWFALFGLAWLFKKG